MTHQLRFSKWPALLALFVALSCTAKADVTLPGFFGDHMVLQQKQPVRVWGWAEPDESVRVTIGDHNAETRAAKDGRWEVSLPAMQATNEPITIQIQGKNKVELSDVLIGEVWLCSGQSNMEWSVRASANADAEIASANYPLIRHIKVPRRPSMDPMDDITADWQVCSPDTVGNFTACGYFMARRLHRDLDVPIGLVNSSWGGTRVEPWTPPIGFQQVDAVRDIYQSVMQRTPGTEAYRNRLNQHVEATRGWLQNANEALQSNTRVAPSPSFPSELEAFKSHQDPTMLYNGMIHALVGFPIRGAIWYQGESNHNEGMLYFEKKKALIGGWRELWNQGDFPFYYVQIAPFQYGGEDPEILARFWEAQAAVQQVPNTGMVVINDIATLDNIHPPNKQDVGERLALLALKNDYGRSDLVAESPEMDSMQILEGQLKITFKNSGGGLKTRDGQAPTHFEVIGPGSYGYQPANAVIQGDSVLLSSPNVPNPVAFRFAWHKLAEPNLTGATGLPVGAFRGGDEPDFLSTLAIEKQYQLVYDLDLKTLGRDIHYDADHSDQVTQFDRVGYLLELNPENGPAQKLFVSMDAFTDRAEQLGIPTLSSKAFFQQNVENLDVFSNVPSIKTGTSIAKGNIEFWPNNYGPQNAGRVPKASSQLYDFGDDPAEPRDGYGCMQVHHFDAEQTLFAINHWGSGADADVGIGNSSGEQRDWTFSGNAKSYTEARLRIYVRTKP